MTQQRPDQPDDITRRRIMQRLVAAVPLAAIGASAAKAEPSADIALAAATMGLITTNVCAVKPETTEGPYYIDPKLVRSDITEGKAGIPLRLSIQVVTADCRPVAGARVDIWHCDAQGNYSGYANQGSDGTLNTEGQTFLRGTWPADDSGIATFDTIYPGWYRGRTTHIHYKIYLDERTVLTSQIFFPDALSEYLFLNAAAYQRSDTRDTVNKGDGIAAEAGEGAYCAIREQADRYIAALVVGIDPDATWTEGGQGMGGPGRGGPEGGPGGGMPPGPPPEGSAPPGQMPGQPPEAGDPADRVLFPDGV
ncbi:intradiol ring-cleavage dioxygenase [Ketogulonicigenium vulgare]|uniref:intradiol ring-cleavage dioxygenase n=1 Tax=Ketogulonicigenium vulgare TaxID=92945 RepID=UPI002358A9ED|nr:intradiol ring-cleavage dioxygenase [Ketogulonicigenium vulgare]